MSEQGRRQADVNKQVVSDYFRLFMEGDLDGVMARQTDDCEWDISTGAASGTVPWFYTCQGKEATLKLIDDYLAAADVEVYEITEYYADGDKVFALGRQKAVSKITGKSFETGILYIMTMRDGKIARLDFTCDTAAAQAAFTPD